MRLTNRHRIPLYHFFNTIILLIVIACVVMFISEKYAFNILGSEEYLLILIPIILLALTYLRGKQIFEYDSEGETFTFKNRTIYNLFGKTTVDEFPKYKLISYNIANYIFFEKLYIYINSKKNNQLILKYDISYLSKKEISDLKFSLSKIIKINKENKKTDDNEA